jgi:hypothetical protein
MSMNHVCGPWVRLALGVVLCSATALAQLPKPGPHYVDEAVLGFKIQAPKDWVFIPPQPKELNLLGKYAPPGEGFIFIGQTQRGFSITLPLFAWLVKFDRNLGPLVIEHTDGGRTVKQTIEPIASFEEWVELENGLESEMSWGRSYKITETRELKVDGVAAKIYEVTGRHDQSGDEPIELKVFAAVYPVSPDVDVALVFDAPGGKKWHEWEDVCERFAKSFRRVEVKAAKAPAREVAHPDDTVWRAARRAALEEDVRVSPGWKLYETYHYFVISDSPDEPFVEELMERLEAIHAVYERDYPEDKARRSGGPVRTGADDYEPQPPGGDDEGGGDDDEGGDDEEADDGAAPESPGAPDDAGTAAADPASTKRKPKDWMDGLPPAPAREKARCSVVRVCKNASEYHDYGGPPGSAGYWYNVTEELVVYDDQQYGGRNNTWAVVNHEAFHQFIFYFYGSISPHSWYNEGTGDFYAGYDYKAGKFKLKPFEWRETTIKEMIREGAYAPLGKFVRLSQAQYYGNNKLGPPDEDGDPTPLPGGALYAQGWSFVYFLRTGKGKAKNWDPRWESILDTYLATLAETGSTKKAVEKAFAGVDFERLEESWKSYIG